MLQTKKTDRPFFVSELLSLDYGKCPKISNAVFGLNLIYFMHMFPKIMEWQIM